MQMPAPIHHQQSASNTPAIVRVFEREDVLWNRPVFKAPPLTVVPPLADISELAFGVRKPDALVRSST
jgi:hypothetical protein